ncbi:D-alanyl-D-alanine carboxypeptidase [Christensenella sp. MSJ-20]|uniref:D-alanyl-D-alanine carboxypeptidase family protein n=1 Tax=Christensenella sp. MSJ-20 TaxID=2841518 RepID=UPI001C78CBA0|nr:D-alanyl-D-alanine carboxypeptidase [Christensenella sp. MSJ-20]
MRRSYRRLICGILILCTLLLSGTAFAGEVAPSAKGASLVEITTGRILYSKNGDAPMPMASTTKVMTALLAVESGKLNEVVTVPKEAVGVEGSSLYLEEGEQFTLLDLTYGLMMQSGNDAATVIAIYLGGSVEGFAAMMNEKARELGAKNTNFVNPHGLPAKNHYTSANDLGIISAAAMRNQDFSTIVSTKYYEMMPKGSGTKRTIKNKNKLLWNYESATGVKTGYTIEAGKCLVASSARDRLEVVSVVLSCPNMWDDATSLLDYGHENFWLTQIAQEGEEIATLPVENGELDTTPVLVEKNAYYPLRVDDSETVKKSIDLPSSVPAPVEENQVLGTITYSLGDTEIAKINLLAGTAVNKQSFFFKIKRFFQNLF